MTPDQLMHGFANITSETDEALYAAMTQDDQTVYFYSFYAYMLGNTGTALAEDVMVHRRIEPWGEGFRWFDLKRLNLPCERKGSNYDATFCGFLTRTQGESGWVYEIPKIGTDFNTLMDTNY